MNRAIQCKYSCDQCGIHRAIITVTAREDENVVEWMNTKAAPAASADHDRRSPDCKITSLSELLIPIFEGKLVGEPE